MVMQGSKRGDDGEEGDDQSRAARLSGRGQHLGPQLFALSHRVGERDEDRGQVTAD